MKIQLKRKLSTDSIESKPKNKKKVETIDQEKENKNNKMSWPEQLARSKQARAETRNSIDSLDSMEMELANEKGSVVTPKKAIVLPILGKKKIIKEDQEENKKSSTTSNKSKPKAKKGEEAITTNDQPPELEPQITIPPIKKRLKQAEDLEPVSKPKTSTKKNEASEKSAGARSSPSENLNLYSDIESSQEASKVADKFQLSQGESLASSIEQNEVRY